MIDPTFVRMMARYNRWQNENLYAAADTLTEDQRRADLGAYFGSIHGTLSHVMWGDRTWMSRFADVPAPGGGIKASPALYQDWDDLKAARLQLDAAILTWADAIDAERLSGTLRWFSGAAGREIERPMGALVVHFFNHQTHHRGQVHAMLTRSGARPGDTDLFLMSS